MPMTAEQIVEQAMALPSEARALLADRLVQSLAASEGDAVWQQWAAEAARRQADIRSGRVQPVASGDALARVRNAIA